VVTVIALLTETPKKEPVAVWFVHSTNEMGEKKLVFEGTNGTSRPIEFISCVVTGEVRHRGFYDASTVCPSAGTNFDFTVKMPPKDAPYYVRWEVRDHPLFVRPWNRFRVACGNFFRAHGMPALAGRFYPTARWHYIFPTDIKE
jgi:hypothetical protein